jgi:hypothetical protein
MKTDFDDRVDIIPVSDPNVFSQAQRIALAQTKLQLAGAAPEMHNMYEVYRDMYDALGVRDVDRIMRRIPDDEPTPKDPAQENIDAMDMIPLKAFEGQEHQAHIMAHMAEQADAQNDQAKLQLDAQNQQLRADQFQQRLAAQERQTQARIQSAMERELLKLGRGGQ